MTRRQRIVVGSVVAISVGIPLAALVVGVIYVVMGGASGSRGFD